MSTTGTAIVTGGSQGIGAGLVTRFLEKGYNVVGNSRAIVTPGERPNLDANARSAAAQPADPQ
jgi:NAD(P)-dependent dehydrogenase (short-subunit alcohol dehydrogenase family)